MKDAGLTRYQVGILDALRKGAVVARVVADQKGGVTRYRYTCAHQKVLRTAIEALEKAGLIGAPAPDHPFDRVEYALISA